MFRSRIRRAWGHAAIPAWSDLILARSRKLVGLQSPAASACATRAGGDSGSNSENHDLFHAQSSDTGYGAHARSWRANQELTSGVSFLGSCLRVLVGSVTTVDVPTGEGKLCHELSLDGPYPGTGE